jgi:hypothetical protein
VNGLGQHKLHAVPISSAFKFTRLLWAREWKFIQIKNVIGGGVSRHQKMAQ